MTITSVSSGCSIEWVLKINAIDALQSLYAGVIISIKRSALLFLTIFICLFIYAHIL